MLVIPVVDIRHGVAVRAVAGDRASYQPLVSPLAQSSEPAAVVAGLMALYPFPVIYLADLDAIEGRRGGNMTLADQILKAWPACELWIDCGASRMGNVEAFLTLERTRMVIGSETGVSRDEMRALSARFGDDVILSLDYRGAEFVGDAALALDASSWPSRVIVMTLANVGSSSGPALELISAKTAQAGPRRHVFAAGGVRDRRDLAALAVAGAAGALVATALHAQTITAADLG